MGTRLISETTDVLLAELNESAEAPTSNYSTIVPLLRLRIIRSSNKGV